MYCISATVLASTCGLKSDGANFPSARSVMACLNMSRGCDTLFELAMSFARAVNVVTMKLLNTVCGALNFVNISFAVEFCLTPCIK